MKKMLLAIIVASGVALTLFAKLDLIPTDNQGWRLDVPGFPMLTTAGGAYSADDVREVLAYAKERHITVVPEIDFPGHFGAACRAYPSFGCKPRARVMCVGNPEAIVFAEKNRPRILGGQCCNWTEKTKSFDALESKLWPRALALAEVLWTFPDVGKRDFAEF